MRTKENKGVTLIALAVTVIVLLIISGVTISYMTGENGIINQSKESKKFAGTVEEKEVLNTSVAAAVGKSSKSKVEENNLKKYLNQNVGDEVKDYTLEKRDGYYSVTFTATGNEYAVWENGTVQDMEEYQKTPYLKLDPSELNALETESSQVIKAITNVDNPNISWETNNSNIVTIQKKSNTEITVTGKNNGSAVITAKMDKLETKCQVTVITSPKEIILSNTEITIDLSSGNKTVQITPTITPDSANKNITWTSSNTSIARVDEFGTITGISNGEATVTAKTVNGLTKICKVKVVTSPTAISLNKTNAVIDTTTSKNMQLTAVITPASANIYTGITWTSSNDNVVQVNQQGLVKGISNGLATVTAKTENGCTAQCRIVVGATIAGINLAPSNSAIEIEEKLQINATIEPNTSEETLIWVSSNSKVATVDQNGLVTGVKAGVVTITVKNPSGDKFDTATITVTQKPTESTPVENVKFSTEYGRIDVIWLDNNNNVISNPNAPILTSNGESLTPIKWNGSSEQTTNSGDGSWYNYNSNMWANAKTKNGSYFVWIPRFAYRIRYYSDSNCTKLTGYFDGLGQWSKDGKLRRKLDSGIQTVNYNDESYIVHPAFETNLENGGWSNELSGFWVAKFQASPTSYREVKFVPGENSSNIDRSIGQQYYYARTAKYGYNGTKDSDGYTSFMYSHMMKNSEWGAVAYLTHSKYGKNGNEIAQNTSYYTGGGYNGRYTSYTSQSSTGNVYGIYDLSGCAYEYVAAFISKDSYGKFSTYDWTRYTGLKETSASTKYATRYDNNYSSYYTGNFIVYNCGKIGDASKEVNTGGHDKTDSRTVYKNWLKDDSNFPYSEYPFFVRGGNRSDSTYSGLAGVFFTGYADGHNSNDNSFRTVLCP